MIDRGVGVLIRRGGRVTRIGLMALMIMTLFAAGRFAPSATPAVPAGDDLCAVAPTRIEPLPAEAFPGLRSDQARAVPDDARCSVCGMYPARAPRFPAQMIYQDGATRFFDTPIDLVRFLRERRRFDPDRHAQPLAARFVTAFDSGGWIAFDTAIFVLDSTLVGPMRSDGAPAFADLPAARRFIDRHGGTIIIGGGALTRALNDASPATIQRHGHGH